MNSFVCALGTWVGGYFGGFSKQKVDIYFQVYMQWMLDLPMIYLWDFPKNCPPQPEAGIEL
jgi:hypothetical protein